MSELNSFIAISDDFSQTLVDVKIEFPDNRVIDFVKDSFLVDDAKSVVKEAYIAEVKTKILFLAAKSFNTYAQNSLLKILEEPPKNVVFVVCVPSKTTLLATIRSRLPIRVFSKKVSLESSGLDFKRLNVKDVYEFLDKNRYLPKFELQNLIQSITNEALRSGMNFNESELDAFAKILQLASLNTNAQILLSTQLSIILNKALHEVQ